jgi:hypothetical protein
MFTTINMANVRISDVIFDKGNVVGIFTSENYLQNCIIIIIIIIIITSSLAVVKHLSKWIELN